MHWWKVRAVALSRRARRSRSRKRSKIRVRLPSFSASIEWREKRSTNDSPKSLRIVVWSSFIASLTLGTYNVSRMIDVAIVLWFYAEKRPSRLVSTASSTAARDRGRLWSRQRGSAEMFLMVKCYHTSQLAHVITIPLCEWAKCRCLVWLRTLFLGRKNGVLVIACC